MAIPLDLPTLTFELAKPFDIVLTLNQRNLHDQAYVNRPLTLGYVSLLFCGSQNFLALQLMYLINERKHASIFNDGIGHLRWVTILACSPQFQFIPTTTFSTFSTIQIYLVRCTLPKVTMKMHQTFFPNCYNQILWIILKRLQVDMSVSSSKLNVFKHFQRKTNHILESWKWLNNFIKNS
jgi:VanZ family protein